jgi:hypothetical protein
MDQKIRTGPESLEQLEADYAPAGWLDVAAERTADSSPTSMTDARGKPPEEQIRE